MVSASGCCLPSGLAGNPADGLSPRTSQGPRGPSADALLALADVGAPLQKSAPRRSSDVVRPADPFSRTPATAKWQSFLGGSKTEPTQHGNCNEEVCTQLLFLPARAGLLALLLSVPNKSEITELRGSVCTFTFSVNMNFKVLNKSYVLREAWWKCHSHSEAWNISLKGISSVSYPKPAHSVIIRSFAHRGRT